MLKDKTILVTSGGTREYIDDVRVLTNISTGKLGSKITDLLYECGATIHYVHGVGAQMPHCNGQIGVISHPVSSAKDLYTKMHNLFSIDKIDAVVHCAAVSDFTFSLSEGPIKCKSDSAEDFIEHMRRSIIKNPKIIGMIKTWDPSVLLVGFKFEVGVTFDTLKQLATKSILNNSCDLVVANDKKEMQEKKTHVGHLFFSDNMKERGFKDKTVNGKDEIASAIVLTMDGRLI